MNSSGLVFNDVRFRRGSFSLETDTVLPPGKLTVILGPSGCGKTTLLDLAAGFLHPAEGRILEGGVDVTDLPPEKRRIGVVFQDHALFPHMTVMRNIMFGPVSRGVARKEAAGRAEELISLVRLEGYGHRRPSSLSGGEKQRVALARALAINPDILLLDEPFSALDAALRREMRTEVKRIQKLTGITALLVTHDQEEALAVADHLAVMDRGRIIETGPPVELWRNPRKKFTAFFLGRGTRLRVRDIACHNGIATVATAAGSLELPADILPAGTAEEGPNPEELWLTLRPDCLELAPDGPWTGRVSEREFAGGSWRLTILPGDADDGEYLYLETREDRFSGLPEPGDNVWLKPMPMDIRILTGG